MFTYFLGGLWEKDFAFLRNHHVSRFPGVHNLGGVPFQVFSTSFGVWRKVEIYQIAMRWDDMIGLRWKVWRDTHGGNLCWNIQTRPRKLTCAWWGVRVWNSKSYMISWQSIRETKQDPSTYINRIPEHNRLPSAWIWEFWQKLAVESLKSVIILGNTLFYLKQWQKNSVGWVIHGIILLQLYRGLYIYKPWNKDPY